MGSTFYVQPSDSELCIQQFSEQTEPDTSDKQALNWSFVFIMTLEYRARKENRDVYETTIGE